MSKSKRKKQSSKTLDLSSRDDLVVLENAVDSPCTPGRLCRECQEFEKAMGQIRELRLRDGSR